MNNEDTHLSTQNLGGGELVIFEALFKSLLLFNVLKTCRVYLLVTDLGIVKFLKKSIKHFFQKCEICRR